MSYLHIHNEEEGEEEENSPNSVNVCVSWVMRLWSIFYSTSNTINVCFFVS